MPPTWTVVFSIMSAIAAITSAALLYKASLPLPHGKSSFSGQTPFEAAFRVTRRRYVVAGMGGVGAAIAVLCSLAVALGAYLNMGVSN
jgi:hypothetical protein